MHILALETDLNALSKSAFQYGPFFFSLIFLYSITRWANQRYQESINLPPGVPGRDGAIATNRKVFVGSFVFGILLTLVSVGWWWIYRPNVYIFRGRICALRSYDVISSPVLYEKEMDRAPMSGDPERYRDEDFVMVQDRPFKANQQFEVDYFKQGGRDAMQRLYVAYRGSESDETPYDISFKEGKYSLVQESQTSLSSLKLFKSVAVYAQESMQQEDVARQQSQPQVDVAKQPPLQQDDGGKQSRIDEAMLLNMNRSNPVGLFSVLQSSSTPVGMKLDALTMVTRLTPNYWLGLTLPEPPLITLIDLTRYGDEEIAYIANKYLVNINLSMIVVNLLSDPSTQSLGREAFMHLDNNSCAIVLGWLSSVNSPLYKSLKEIGNPLQLAGTPSPKGDRYYVRSSWNPEDNSTVQCLANAFNQELITARTLQDELALMRDRSSRLVYWYDKDWAMHIRDVTIRCGGQARFLVPGAKLNQ